MPASCSCPESARGGAEPGGSAGLPPLLRRSPGAGSNRCLGGVLAVVWLAPGAGDAGREPGAAAPRVTPGGAGRARPSIPEATTRTGLRREAQLGGDLLALPHLLTRILFTWHFGMPGTKSKSDSKTEIK
ncbi:probable G-protein coupled receptor 160 isoform X2 [Manis pentadactyla]|uniref:probable G-protein coupled receptor 160 isoform X2 n=1 Tax=Manis pentadactyla TaxID=143292 RepID=UPI00255CA7A0|nr:probable G-protein coupled receptor 160 isoform X2 [Manis pentadactyla]